jgi:hypothetical protein
MLGVPITAALADDPPLPRLGLWEITVTTEKSAYVAQQCVEEPTPAALRAKVKAEIGAPCSKLEEHREGDKYIRDSVCVRMGSKRTSHAETTYVGDNEFNSVSLVSYNPPLMGVSDAKTTVSAKWRGACGPDINLETRLNGRRLEQVPPT